MVYSVRVYVQMIYHINIPVFTNWRNKIYYMYFQHIEMSYKRWVHSSQGIYNLQNYITIAHLNIRYHGILHLEYFVGKQPKLYTMYSMNELSLPKHSNVKQTPYRNSLGLSILIYWQASKTKTGGNLFTCYHPSLALTILRGRSQPHQAYIT